MFEKGLKIRTEVLGEEYVARAINNANDFNQDFQEFFERGGPLLNLKVAPPLSKDSCQTNKSQTALPGGAFSQVRLQCTFMVVNKNY